MSLCDKENPCNTCRYAPYCGHPQGYDIVVNPTPIEQEKQIVFGCGGWFLHDDLLEEQIRRNIQDQENKEEYGEMVNEWW